MDAPMNDEDMADSVEKLLETLRVAIPVLEGEEDDGPICSNLEDYEKVARALTKWAAAAEGDFDKGYVAGLKSAASFASDACYASNPPDPAAKLALTTLIKRIEREQHRILAVEAEIYAGRRRVLAEMVARRERKEETKRRVAGIRKPPSK